MLKKTRKMSCYSSDGMGTRGQVKGVKQGGISKGYNKGKTKRRTRRRKERETELLWKRIQFVGETGHPTNLFLWMMATKARPSLQEVVKFLTSTLGYLWVVRRAHRSSASLAVRFSSWPTMISEIWKGEAKGTVVVHYRIRWCDGGMMVMWWCDVKKRREKTLLVCSLENLKKMRQPKTLQLWERVTKPYFFLLKQETIISQRCFRDREAAIFMIEGRPLLSSFTSFPFLLGSRDHEGHPKVAVLERTSFAAELASLSHAPARILGQRSASDLWRHRILTWRSLEVTLAPCRSS